MSISLKRKKILQKEKCHSSVFRKVFQISRKKFSCHIHFNVINEHYDIDISDKLIFCKDRGHNLRKNDTQDLVPNLSRTSVLNIVFFNRIGRF